MENLELYNKLKSVPQEYLKTIQAGRLKGMSDIKPQWRIQQLTEVFGPCGIGWKIQNLSYSYKEVGQEIVCNCYLELLFKYNNEWSEPIPASGGNKLATMERNGLYVSDEAEKMAYTDALSVACKMIGVASDVYMGHGGKYDNPKDNNQSQQTNDLKWLNVLDANKKPTQDYKIVCGKIQALQYKSLDDIRKDYKISKETEASLLKALEKYQSI